MEIINAHAMLDTMNFARLVIIPGIILSYFNKI